MTKHESTDRHLVRGAAAVVPAFVAVSGMLAGSEACAQSGSDRAGASRLEEVTVSARRREESLQDVPASITAFSAGDLVDNNVDDVTDYFTKTPNVSFTESGTRGERNISIRGVSNLGGQVQALAFYIDEFNIVNGPQTANTGNTNSTFNPQLYDVERIEVLRGPQGTYFGRNATGGAINITTKKPTNEFHGEVSAGYGRLSTWEVGGVLNVPLAPETLLFRTSVFYQESDGFVDNVNPVGGGSGTEFLNYRAALRFQPSANVMADLTVNYTKEDQGTSETVANGVLDGGSAGLLRALRFTGAINEVAFYPGNRREVNHDVKDDQQNEFVTIVGKIDWQTEWFTVTSVTGYLDTDFDSINDLDFTSFGFLDQDRHVTTDSISEELRFAGTVGDSVEWLLGGIYAEDDKNQKFAVVPGSAGFLGLPPGFLIDTGDITFETESFAVFGELTWHATDRLALTVGGRYTDDEVSQRVEGVNFGRPDVPGQGEVGFTDFSPRFAVAFDLTDDVTLYASASKGYKAGGLQLNVTQQLPIFDFDEETIWNYEGGVKLRAFDGRASLGLAVFYMDWEDLQVSTNLAFVDPVTNQITFLNVTDNAASASTKGVEFEARFLPTEGLEFGATAGYLDAEFDSFPDAFVLGSTVDLSDRRIPRAPQWTLSADGEYRFPLARLSDGLAGLGDAYFRAEWSYRDETVPGIDSLVRNAPHDRPDAFDIVNFRAGFEGRRLRVDAYVENAFDEEYFTTFDAFGFAGARIHPTYRTYGVKIRYKFD